MRKQVTHIPDVPEEWKGLDDFSSHRPALWLAVSNTKGVVMELGSGNGSSQLLRETLKKEMRAFHSFETNMAWADITGAKFIDYPYLNLQNVICKVLFIDSAPAEERKYLLAKHNMVDVLIIHDSEESSSFAYGLEEILSTFKYRIDYQPVGNPHTSILSNTINICEWV